MVYGESGRFPVAIAIKKKMIGYWGRLLTGKSTKLVKLIYNCEIDKAEIFYLNG